MRNDGLGIFVPLSPVTLENVAKGDVVAPSRYGADGATHEVHF